MKPYGCALCLEPDNVHTITLKCHHKYHQNCITLWIDSGVRKFIFRFTANQITLSGFYDFTRIHKLGSKFVFFQLCFKGP